MTTYTECHFCSGLRFAGYDLPDCGGRCWRPAAIDHLDVLPVSPPASAYVMQPETTVGPNDHLDIDLLEEGQRYPVEAARVEHDIRSHAARWADLAARHEIVANATGIRRIWRKSIICRARANQLLALL